MILPPLVFPEEGKRESYSLDMLTISYRIYFILDPANTPRPLTTNFSPYNKSFAWFRKLIKLQ
jgi:hypothetical protein